MAIGDLATEKTEKAAASPVSGRDTADLKQQPTSGASLAAQSLARDWLESQQSSDLSSFKKAGVVLESAVVGTMQNGLDRIKSHPGEVAAEVAGAVALGLALKGPIWTKAPALAFTAVGTVAYGKQLFEAGVKTTDIVDRMNSRNLEASRQGLKETLGPVVFDSALMYAAGAGAAKLAPKLPAEASQLRLAETLTLAKDRVGELLDVGEFPGGMQPALAGAYGGGRAFGGGRSSGNFFETVMPTPKPPAENVMQMSAMGDSGKGIGGSGGSNAGADGLRFRTSRGPNGESFVHVDNMPASGSVKITHGNGMVTSVNTSGEVMIGFAGGEGRKLALGQNINRVAVTEHTNGLKQFRFNDKIAADLEVDNNGHTLRALLGNGDHVHMIDNVQNGYMHFPHKDGLQTWVEHGGRVVIQLPTGKVHEVQLPEKLAYIRLLEKADGTKEFRFLNDSGAPVKQTIQLPSTPELQEIKAPDEIQNWHDLRNYVAAKQHARANLHHNVYDDALQDIANGGGGGMHRVQPSSHGTLYPNHDGHHQGNVPFMFPTSYERVMARELVGVPAHIMRGNDLSAPADMELALQGHSWLVTNYLDRLDYQEPVHHHDW